MNIFVLEHDVAGCARSHCDQHVSKMILESVQMLCTALRSKGFETPYRMTYERCGPTEFAQAMPDEYKVPGDAVTAYRRFYLAEKSAFARWKYRLAPDWWTADAA